MDNSPHIVYNKIASLYDKSFFKPSKYLDEFEKMLGSRSSVLDVGCGTGIDAGYLSKKGHQVIGVDLSSGMLKIAKQRFPKIKFITKDFTRLTYKAESFDSIVASCSLIHIPKKIVPKTLKGWHRMIKRNGVLYLQLQGGRSEELYIQEPFKPDEELFVNVFSCKEIIDLLRQLGFKIITKRYETGKKIKGELIFKKIYIIAKK